MAPKRKRGASQRAINAQLEAHREEISQLILGSIENGGNIYEILNANKCMGYQVPPAFVIVAAQRGNFPAFVDIVTHIKDQGCTEYGMEYALHEASLRGHLNIVRHIIRNEGIDVDCKLLFQGRRALHNACREGHIDIVSYLIDDVHADVNVQASCGMSPLYAATVGGHSGIVSMLLNAGANATLRGSNVKNTPLHVAASLHYDDIATQLIPKSDLLKRNDRGHIPLLEAEEDSTFELLLPATATAVDAHSRRNALHEIFASEHLPREAIAYTAQRLISAGCDVNATAFNGATPLECALATNNTVSERIVDVLLAAGAKIPVSEQGGWSILHQAVLLRNLAIVKKLVRAGADITAAFSGNGTPLELAVDKNAYDIAHYLLIEDKGRSWAVVPYFMRCKALFEIWMRTPDEDCGELKELFDSLKPIDQQRIQTTLKSLPRALPTAVVMKILSSVESRRKVKFYNGLPKKTKRYLPV